MKQKNASTVYKCYLVTVYNFCSKRPIPSADQACGLITLTCLAQAVESYTHGQDIILSQVRFQINWYSFSQADCTKDTTHFQTENEQVASCL